MEASAHKQEPNVTVGLFLKQYWVWFGLLLLGKRSAGNVDIAGVSMRFNGTHWFTVVTGLRVTDMQNVVCFGSSETLYGSLRNVTTSISKAHWKIDQYHPPIGFAGHPEQP